MAYIKIVYQNSPSTATPLNAENLNHMDDQIALNDQRLTELEGAHVSSFNGRTGAVVPADNDYNIGQIAPLTGAQVGQVPVVTNIGTEEDPELVFRMGEGGGAGGHEIIDSSGNTMPQESAMQFADSFVSDDETNGRTIVENIKEHTTASDYENATEDGIHVIDDGNDVPIGEIEEDVVSVTADGVKTWKQLYNELYGQIDTSKLTNNTRLEQGGQLFTRINDDTSSLIFVRSVVSQDTYGNKRLFNAQITLNSTSSALVSLELYQNNTNGYDDRSNDKPSDGTVITLYYGTSSTVINLKTDANYCQYDENNTVKQKIDSFEKHTFGTVIDLLNTTLPYTVPSDGYIGYTVKSGSAYGLFYVNTLQVVIPQNGSYNTGNMIFVRKGTQISGLLNSSSFIGLGFIPLT